MGHKHISQYNFNRVKALRRSGMTLARVAGETGHGIQTVMVIDKASNLEEYQRNRRAINDKHRGVVRILPANTNKPVFSPIHSRRRKTRRNLKPADFERVHMLLGAQLTQAQVADVMGLSKATVKNVAACADWAAYEDFKEYQRSYKTRLRQQLPQDVAEAFSQPELPIEVTHEPATQQMGVDAKTLEALAANTAALADLALAWNQLTDKLDEVLETKKPWLERIKH